MLNTHTFEFILNHYLTSVLVISILVTLVTISVEKYYDRKEQKENKNDKK